MPEVKDPEILRQLNADVAKGPVYGAPPKAEKPPAPPAGYSWGPPDADGRPTLVPYTGGPADPNSKPGGTEKPAQVPATLATSTENRVGQFVALDTAGKTFQDDFGGNAIGGLENFAQRFVDVGTPGQQQWWAAFKATDNQIRNDLFGSALTATEKAAYEATTISPGMRPELIRENIGRRAAIVRSALARQREFMIANGYRPEAVDALFAPILEAQQALEAGAAAPDEAKPMSAPEAGNIPGVDVGGGEELVKPGQATKSTVMAGVNEEYRRRLAAGASGDELVAYLKSAGIDDPKPHMEAKKQAAYRKRFPNVPIEDYPVNFTQSAPVTGAEQAINSAAQSSIGSALISAGDAASGFTLDNIAGAAGANPERVRAGIDQISRNNPIASVAGMLAGGTTAALGVEGALGLGGVAAGIGRTLGADALYGAGAGAGATDYASDGSPATTADRLFGAGKGAAAATAGSALGSGVVGMFGKGVSQPAVKALQDEKIPLTIGQQFAQSGKAGAMVKGIEDRVSGLPVIGDMVNARRMEGLEAFNAAAFDRALKPIGRTVAGKTGEEAMEAADQAVSDAYQAALGGKSAAADPKFAQDFTIAVTRAMNLPRVGDEVAGEIEDIVQPYMAGTTLSGDAMQQISRDLRAYKAKWSTDTSARRVGKAIDDVEDAIFGMFQRQAPEVIPEYNKAKLAAQRLYTLERAVLAADKHEGVFTAAQLSTADKQATIAYGGRRKAAKGAGEFRKMARDGQAVLPSKVPDSGTAGRVLIPAAALGAGGAADQWGGTGGAGLTLAAIFAGAYTKAGQRLLTKPGRGSKGGVGKVLQNEVVRKAIPAAAGASATALTVQ